MIGELGLISIVMGVYNGEQFLHECLNSLFEQTYENFEIIVVDDASNDKTSDILQSYIMDKRLKVITNCKNIGLTKSLNKGVKHAKGQYIARQDVDDISNNKRLEILITILDNNPEINVVGTSFHNFTGNFVKPQNENEDLKLTILDIEDFRFNNPLTHGSILARKEAIDNVMGYSEVYKRAQDYDLWLKLIKQGQIAIIDAQLYYRRLHSDCISINSILEQEQCARLAFSHHFENRNVLGIQDKIYCRKRAQERLFKYSFRFEDQQFRLILKAFLMYPLPSAYFKYLKLRPW